MTPAIPLEPPPGASGQGEWTVLVQSAKVRRGWISLVVRAPENCVRCYEHLNNHPMQRVPQRIYPLKGKEFKGGWEYEITGGDRVCYKVDPEEKTVLVYYAGPHPPKTPPPPR